MNRWRISGGIDHSVPGMCCFRCCTPRQGVRLIQQDGRTVCLDCAFKIPTSYKERLASGSDPLIDGRFAKFGGRTSREIGGSG